METAKDGGKTILECRAGCGACCIAPSISSTIPGMPQGKPAGVRCIQLTNEHRCKLFGKPERPAVCASLKPLEEMCGASAREAFQKLARLERATCLSGVAKKVSRRCTGQRFPFLAPVSKARFVTSPPLNRI